MVTKEEKKQRNKWKKNVLMLPGYRYYNPLTLNLFMHVLTYSYHAQQEGRAANNLTTQLKKQV
jgi:hypothetical protein